MEQLQPDGGAAAPAIVDHGNVVQYLQNLASRPMASSTDLQTLAGSALVGAVLGRMERGGGGDDSGESTAAASACWCYLQAAARHLPAAAAAAASLDSTTAATNRQDHQQVVEWANQVLAVRPQ
jgi:hypothetical protein